MYLLKGYYRVVLVLQSTYFFEWAKSSVVGVGYTTRDKTRIISLYPHAQKQEAKLVKGSRVGTHLLQSEGTLDKI